QAVPWCFEAVTPNVAGVIGLSAALKWLNGIDLVAAERWSSNLAAVAEARLAAALPGFVSFLASGSSLLAFNVAGVHHSDVVTLLADSGVSVRAGQHCA
ncbi:aminotransferase class V-fold PLP-dependent enzyme, partial [Erwinia amylovora]|uniref:aminotransferase class V-fold PLP-dependent enzyme n=1 Tax=Erwinia amylovora TaxID=552 RepID=UPI0020BD8125